ncbi:glycoside hydrolase family 16 protein [Roridomyces roridus]|uniref:Glycoside hydrolase family 16 protein n=1 Tax=Roridomyces roridus TaxID=1738132 RepID=A0AAD7C257_9AGAR|nr:glycoside hydrolase family 16 protein [Roridomyces roridus]
MNHHARVAEQKRSDVSGIAYYGFQNNTENACGTMSSDDDMIIGVSSDYFADGSKCFQHIQIALQSDPSKSVDVTLTDLCTECGPSGNVYVSPAAFKALNNGDLDVGVLDVTWSLGSSSSSDSSSESAPSSTEEDTPAPTTTAKAAPATVEKAAAATTTTSKAVAATTSKAAAKVETSTKTTATTSTKQATSTGTSNEGWKLSSKLEGQDFLNFFNYDSGTGDNGGSANYVNGVKEGLAYVSNGQVILAVDDAESVSARNSLRMVSKTTFNAGDQNLFVFDIAHMPAVCGTWPAVWLTGANWPYQGEIDVVEGVSLYNKNIYSVHTGSGCSFQQSDISALTKVQLLEATGLSCDANSDPGACGFSDTSSTTFGPGFNKAGGGVFALQYDTSGIQMWFFAPDSVPSDITSLAPNPSTWGSPRMAVPKSTCNPSTFFKDLMLIVDTNLAGSFTEGVWAVDGAGGQATSCKTQTGVDSAAAYVTGHGSAFGEDAQWKINGFYIYNQ